MSVSINRLVISGNLTKDPELRTTTAGTSVCTMRIANNTRRRDASGEWVDKPNYFDVTVWGAQGERCAEHLAKGRGVMIDGRIEWREWEDGQGNRRQSVEIVAQRIQFIGKGDGGRRDRPPLDEGQYAGRGDAGGYGETASSSYNDDKPDPPGVDEERGDPEPPDSWEERTHVPSGADNDIPF